MTINERIKHIVDECFNGNVSAFSRAIDVPQPTLKDIVGGKFSKPSYSVLEKIVNAESLKISSDWLLSEKGEMIRQNVTQTNQHGDNINTARGSISINKQDDKLKEECERLRKENDRLKDELLKAKQTIIDLMLEGKKA